MHKSSGMKKSKSLRPPLPIIKVKNNSDNDAQFELELCWCIQQLETALNSGKLSQKVAEDTVKNIKILKGCRTPLIKKRQVMKEEMGDYRMKMKEEEKKMGLASKQVKFTSTEETKKSSFVKKSAILTSGKDFKFNFDTSVIKDNQLKDRNKETTDNCKCTNNLHLTLGSEFKFNFDVNEINNKIKFDELSIK